MSAGGEDEQGQVRADRAGGKRQTYVAPIFGDVGLTADIARIGVSHNFDPDVWSSMLGTR